MKDVEELKRKEKHEKRKRLKKKVKQFLREHKGKAYTISELKERMDLDEELTDLMDETRLTSSFSFWRFWFGGSTVESEQKDLETYYYYRFDWSEFISGVATIFIWTVVGFYWIWLIFQL